MHGSVAFVYLPGRSATLTHSMGADVNPTVQQLEQAIGNALGNPSTGPIAENLHLIALAAYNAINQTTSDTRIIHANETRETA